MYHITFIIFIEVPHCKLTLLILHIPLLYIGVLQYMISMLMYIKIVHSFTSIWRFPKSWGFPKLWMVYLMENPLLKWMITRGTPMTQETSKSMYINGNHQQIIPSISMMYTYHHISHINDTFHETCLIFTIHHLLVLSREWMGLGVAGMMKLLVIVDHSRKFPAFSTSKSNQNPTNQHDPYLHIFTIHDFHHQHLDGPWDQRFMVSNWGFVTPKKIPMK